MKQRCGPKKQAYWFWVMISQWLLILFLHPADSQELHITVEAGNGIGNGGSPLEAKLDFPTDVFIGESGSWYILERGRLRVRKVDADGVISTVAGNGLFGLSGDGGGLRSKPVFLLRVILR